MKIKKITKDKIEDKIINLDNKEKTIKIKMKNINKILMIYTILKIFLNQNIYAIDINTFADSSKDLTGILLGIFIAIGIILILLCIAIIVKINTLKKAADTINEYIRRYGHPNDLGQNNLNQNNYNPNNFNSNHFN